MPLEQKIIVDKNTQIGLWKIDEEANYFLERLQLSELEIERIEELSKKTQKRYLHWLASRLSIRTLIGTKRFIKMIFDDQGKPSIINFPYQVSISHSFDYAGVMLSRDWEVGLDIERIDPKIKRIAHKFLNEDELKRVKEANKLEMYYVYWSAKEALFKLHSKHGISFKNNLSIDDFEYSKEGEVVGHLRMKGLNESYRLRYKEQGGYVLSFVIDGWKLN